MGVAGKWNVRMVTLIGTLQFEWMLTSTDGVWRGHMNGVAPVSDSELTDVKVEGDNVSFRTTVQSPMGALQLEFIGKVVNDALDGTCRTKFGDNEFTAVRAA